MKTVLVKDMNNQSYVFIQENSFEIIFHDVTNFIVLGDEKICQLWQHLVDHDQSS